MSGLARWLARGGRFRWNRPVPAEDTGPVQWAKPQTPGAGRRLPGPRQSAASPAPGQPVRPRPWMVAEFYPDGHVAVRDHIARKQFTLTFPTGDDIAAEIIRDLRNDQG